MAARHHRRLKKGGKAQEYNAKGSHEMHEAEETASDGFKKGGTAKKRHRHEKLKAGGHAMGHEAKPRGDRKHRGHHKRAAGGRTPYSSGHHTTTPSSAGKTALGHEGERPEGG